MDGTGTPAMEQNKTKPDQTHHWEHGKAKQAMTKEPQEMTTRVDVLLFPVYPQRD